MEPREESPSGVVADGGIAVIDVPGPTAGSGAKQAGPQGLRGLRAKHPVAAFVARRVGLGILTLFAASFLVFVACNALPGDVARAVLGQNATPELVEQLQEKLSLDRPFVIRYFDWLGGVLTGDLGDSAVAVAQNNPDSSIGSLIADPLRNSLMLALLVMVLLIPIAIALGTFMAVRARSFADHALSYPLLVLGALPEFVLGTVLITVFFSWLGLFSPIAIVPPDESPLSYASTLVLPVLTLVGVLLAFGTRQIRAGVRNALQDDYVRMARLSGIRERRVLVRYALRNALAPSIQTFAQSFQYLFGGIIVVELLFAYPGIGQVLVNAVTGRDVTAVQSITLVLAAVFITLNIVADLLVVFLVPKLRTALQ